MFAQLAGRVVTKVGECGEAPLAVVPFDHANEKNGGLFFWKKCFLLNESGEIGGGPDIYLRCVEFD